MNKVTSKELNDKLRMVLDNTANAEEPTLVTQRGNPRVVLMSVSLARTAGYRIDIPMVKA